MKITQLLLLTFCLASQGVIASEPAKPKKTETPSKKEYVVDSATKSALVVLIGLNLYLFANKIGFADADGCSAFALGAGFSLIEEKLNERGKNGLNSLKAIFSSFDKLQEWVLIPSIGIALFRACLGSKTSNILRDIPMNILLNYLQRKICMQAGLSCGNILHNFK